MVPSIILKFVHYVLSFSVLISLHLSLNTVTCSVKQEIYPHPPVVMEDEVQATFNYNHQLLRVQLWASLDHIYISTFIY
jgi:hypothetical protein